jgi:hypothetical protein
MLVIFAAIRHDASWLELLPVSNDVAVHQTISTELIKQFDPLR